MSLIPKAEGTPEMQHPDSLDETGIAGTWAGCGTALLSVPCVAPQDSHLLCRPGRRLDKAKASDTKSSGTGEHDGVEVGSSSCLVSGSESDRETEPGCAFHVRCFSLATSRQAAGARRARRRSPRFLRRVQKSAGLSQVSAGK